MRFYTVDDAVAAMRAGETHVDLSGVQLSILDLAMLSAESTCVESLDVDNCFMGRRCCEYMPWLATRVTDVTKPMCYVSCARTKSVQVCAECTKCIGVAVARAPHVRVHLAGHTWPGDDVGKVARQFEAWSIASKV